MEFRRLGATGCNISRFGFGCGAASGHDYGPIDETAWIHAVHVALDRGINFFDVADVYGFGHTEELLSRALEEHRHEVIIATKGGLVWDERCRVSRNTSREQIARAIENSLRRLRVSAIPLYQIHWPDPATRVEETLETIADFQQQGKIRFIGVFNFPLQLLECASRACSIDSEQLGYNLLSREAEIDILPWCDARRTSVIAHSVLARGLLAGKRPIGSSFTGSDTRRDSPYFSQRGRFQKQALLDALLAISRRTARTVGGTAIRWVLDNSTVSSVLVGIKNSSQLEDNLTALDTPLEPSDHALLASLSTICPQDQSGVPAHQAVGH